MTSRHIAIASSEDWYGLYVDGHLVYEDHSLQVYEAFTRAGVEVDYIDCEDVDFAVLRRGFPPMLDELLSHVETDR